MFVFFYLSNEKIVKQKLKIKVVQNHLVLAFFKKN